jgi:hypothetical protein
VGFRLFYQWQIGKVVVEPILKTAWEHEYKYSALPITACTGRHIGDPISPDEVVSLSFGINLARCRSRALQMAVRVPSVTQH